MKKLELQVKGNQIIERKRGREGEGREGGRKTKEVYHQQGC